MDNPVPQVFPPALAVSGIENRPPIANAPKKLRRSRNQRLIGGVCGGLGEYLGVDPIIIRLIFAILIIAGGGVLLYMLAWIFIPDNSDQPPIKHTSDLMAKILKGLLLFILISIVLSIVYRIFIT